MMARRRAVFVFNLLQDVNVLRPLVLLVATSLDVAIGLLVSEKFADRDLQGTWQLELDELARLVGGERRTYGSTAEAAGWLQEGGGVLVAASESDLPAHAETHDVLRAAGPSWLTVTLQHGYECVGFLQNRDHSLAHGRAVTFAADVLCGWAPLERMASVAPSERSKYVCTGPSTVLQPLAPPGRAARPGSGIVCENLHSVRLRTTGDARGPFMTTFFAFCEELRQRGDTLTLRPHPGGQYVLKQAVPLPENVTLENRPIYRIDLREHAWGITAPSSVAVDMVLAGLPTAIWQDESGHVDARHYEGLTTITHLADWLAFDRDVRLRPGSFAERQRRWLDASGLMVDPVQVRDRFLSLLGAGLSARALP